MRNAAADRAYARDTPPVRKSLRSVGRDDGLLSPLGDSTSLIDMQ
jgi:hypothetical protein